MPVLERAFQSKDASYNKKMRDGRNYWTFPREGLPYFSLPEALTSRTSETTAESSVAGWWEVKPMPT